MSLENAGYEEAVQTIPEYIADTIQRNFIKYASEALRITLVRKDFEVKVELTPEGIKSSIEPVTDHGRFVLQMLHKHMLQDEISEEKSGAFPERRSHDYRKTIEQELIKLRDNLKESVPRSYSTNEIAVIKNTLGISK